MIINIITLILVFLILITVMTNLTQNDDKNKNDKNKNDKKYEINYSSSSTTPSIPIPINSTIKQHIDQQKDVEQGQNVDEALKIALQSNEITEDFIATHYLNILQIYKKYDYLMSNESAVYDIISTLITYCSNVQIKIFLIAEIKNILQIENENISVDLKLKLLNLLFSLVNSSGGNK